MSQQNPFYLNISLLFDKSTSGFRVLKMKPESQKKLILFKVDFQKAFDLIYWNHLYFVLSKINFPTLWRKWIKECITITTITFLVNGSMTTKLYFQRGTLMHTFAFNSISVVAQWQVYQSFPSSNKFSKQSIVSIGIVLSSEQF